MTVSLIKIRIALSKDPRAFHNRSDPLRMIRVVWLPEETVSIAVTYTILKLSYEHVVVAGAS